MIEFIKQIFLNNKHTVAENEMFIKLIQVAKNDLEIREHLIKILSLDTFNRRSALNTFIEHMSLKNAPQEFILAIQYLLNDEISQKTLKILSE